MDPEWAEYFSDDELAGLDPRFLSRPPHWHLFRSRQAGVPVDDLYERAEAAVLREYQDRHEPDA